MRFILCNSTIRYICYAHNLNIICIILYFDMFTFFRYYYHYNIYAIILISPHRTDGTSCCLFFDIYNKFIVLTTDKPRLFTVVIWLHRILCQQYWKKLRLCNVRTQRWVKFIDIHTTDIFVLHQKDIQEKTRWLFIIVLHFVKSLCDIGQFLINTVIVVTSFVWVQHRFFVVTIVTCECSI